MAKKERVSVNKFEKAVNNAKNLEIDIKWNEIDIKIKKSLSLKEMIAFVKEAIDSCFISDTDDVYHPEIRDFAIRGCVVDFYTNIALPTNIEKRYDMLYQSDIVTVILDNINLIQYQEICDAINRKLNYIEQSKIGLIDKQISEFGLALQDMQDRTSELFSEINPEDIAKLVSSLSGDKLDESKIVEAYLSQKNSTQHSDLSTGNEIVVEEA